MPDREELEREANRIIAAAKFQMELQEEFSPVFLVHFGGRWQAFPMPPGTERILNSADAKKQLFGFFRDLVRHARADGVIFACDTWAGEVTLEGVPHYDTDEWRELNNFGFTKLIQKGWVIRKEAISVTAQNDTEALIVQQPYQRLTNGIQLLTAKRYWVSQRDFAGRQKMFGDLSEKNLGERGW